MILHDLYGKSRIFYFGKIYATKIFSTKPIKCDKDAKLEIHTLVYRGDFLFLLWCIKSFYFHSRLKFKLVIHEDGTLNDNQKAILQQHFQGCRIINKKEADQRIRDYLKGYPYCTKIRFDEKPSLCGIKIFDFCVYSEAEYILVIDPDILFFGTPQEIIESVKKEIPFYLQDRANSYALSSNIIADEFKIKMLPAVNCGLVYYPTVIMKDFSLKEALLKKIFESNDRKMWFEQTTHATLISKYSQTHTFNKLSDEYRVFRDVEDCRTGTHFTYNSKKNNFEKCGLAIMRKQKFIAKFNHPIMSKLNILYYEPSTGFGGSSSNLSHIFKKLDTNTFSPIVVVHEKGPQIKRIESAGFRVIEIPFKNAEDIDRAGIIMFLFLFFSRIMPLVLKLLFIIWKEKIELIHINTNIISGIPMIIAGRLANKKVFCYIRQTRKLIKRERFFVRFVNQFFILSSAALKTYQSDIPQNKINIIYDGVDLEEFNEADPEKFKHEFRLNSSQLVGIVGRIIKGKGQKEFILAAKRVLGSIPDVKFIIVGDAKGGDKQYFSEVKELTEESKLTENVIFTGWRNDVKDIMSSLDIMVLASTTFPEGMPNTIIEAMALQKPVIATNIPGPSEVVIDNDTGFIIPPGDIETMAEKMMYLLRNTDVAKAMGMRGRKRAEEVFNVTDAAQKIEEAYRRVLSRR